ncbi:MAG: 3' terminal RNA ribose 2'-O-methyltransferase Hen1 [Phycisphaerales bacterium]|nr:3' terminal RNA ribose 2'-O-methyltransferase Hen1 [Phycisphaerales bacterium]
MLLTISTTHPPAIDLGYLLHKRPDRLQTFPLSFGSAHVFYPEAGDDRCTAALLLDINPIDLIRGRGTTLDHYVNDRPYVASSMLSVAISQVYGTALAGTCKARPELVATPIPLEASIAALPCTSGEDLIRRLFEPLGYDVAITGRPLDDHFPAWGQSSVVTVRLAGTRTLSELLTHLYVLIPTLDNEKHYWVGDAEVEKLLRHGEGWLASHPERELIARRYLRYRRNLLDEAIRRLREQDTEGPREIDAEFTDDPREEAGEKRLSLHQQRHGVILSTLRARGVRRVLDLGCGEGRLLRDLLVDRSFEKIIGMDVSHRALEIAADRIRLDRMPARQRARVELIHGSLLYRDARLSGMEAAILCEVIEHLDEARLAAMERVVFESIRPLLILVTTPNREYNVMWESLSAGALRHRDHRFEWTRDEFRAWAAAVAARNSYGVEVRPIGDSAVSTDGLDVGAPTQMAVFTLREPPGTAANAASPVEAAVP